MACRIKATEAGQTRNLQRPKESKARRMRIVDGKTKPVVHPSRHLKVPMVEQAWELHVVVAGRLQERWVNKQSPIARDARTY